MPSEATKKWTRNYYKSVNGAKKRQRESGLETPRPQSSSSGFASESERTSAAERSSSSGRSGGYSPITQKYIDKFYNDPHPVQHVDPVMNAAARKIQFDQEQAARRRQTNTPSAPVDPIKAGAANMIRNSAVPQQSAVDMRPSYMRQQAQQAVPQSQTPMSDLVDVWQNESRYEGARAKAKPYEEYMKDISEGRRGDSKDFMNAIVAGKRATNNRFDSDPAADARAALGGGNAKSEADLYFDDDEIDNYYYIAGTQGKKEAENYRQYVIDRKNANAQIARKKLDALYAEQAPLQNVNFETVDSETGERKVNRPGAAITGAANAGVQFLTGMGHTGESLSRLPDAYMGEANYRATGVGDQLSRQMIEDVPEENKTYRTFLELANNMGVNAPSYAASLAFAPAAGTAMFAAQAAGDAYQEVINAGGTVEQARFYAAEQAIDEELTSAVLGSLQSGGSGLLGKAVEKTPVGRAVRDAVKQSLANDPVARNIVQSAMELGGNMASEALQEYTQYYTERLEKWLATGEAPTFNVDGEELTYGELKDRYGEAGAFQRVAGNPEALHAALLGFLNAGAMGGMQAPVVGAQRLANGAALGRMEAMSMADEVDPNVLHYRSGETYQLGKEVRELAQDQIRRQRENAGNSLAAQYGRGLLAEKYADYQRAVADTEMDSDYNDEEMARRYAEAQESRRRAEERRNDSERPMPAVDRLNAKRAEYAGPLRVTEDVVPNRMTFSEEDREQAASDLIDVRRPRRVQWSGGDGGTLTLDREADGTYSFTNQRGETTGVTEEQAIQMLPANTEWRVTWDEGQDGAETAQDTIETPPAPAEEASPTAEPMAERKPSRTLRDQFAETYQASDEGRNETKAYMQDVSDAMRTAQEIAHTEETKQKANEIGARAADIMERIQQGGSATEAEVGRLVRDTNNVMRAAGAERASAVTEARARIGFGEQGHAVMEAANAIGQKAEALTAAYEEARYNIGRNEAQRQLASTLLSPNELSAIYQAGIKDRNAFYNNAYSDRIAKIAEKHRPGDIKKGKVIYDGVDMDAMRNSGDSESRAKYAQMKTIENFLSNVLGYNVEWFESKSADGRYQGENGSYNRSKHLIRLDVNAGAEVVGDKAKFASVVAHELTHTIEDGSPAQYQKLADSVMSMLVADQEYSQGRSAEQIIADMIENNPYVRDEADAIHELVAQACEDMMNGNADVRAMFEGMSDTERQTIFDRISDIFAAIRNFFDELLNSDAVRSNRTEAAAIRRAEENLDALQREWTEGVKQAAAYNAAEFEQNEQNEQMEQAFGDDTGRLTKDADGNIVIAESEDGQSIACSLRTLPTTQAKLADVLKRKGYSEESIKAAQDQVQTVADMLTRVSTYYAEMANALDAELLVDPKTGKTVLHSFVTNGDYPVNIDFLTICKKREAYMHVLTDLIDHGVFDKVAFNGAAIATTNEILRDSGFETACACCFVESRRLQIQRWAETFCSEWNEEVLKRNPNATPFNFSKGERGANDLTQDELIELEKELRSVTKKEKNPKGNIKLPNKGAKANMGPLLDRIPALAHTLSVGDLITPNGIDSLRATDGNLFSLVKQRYGTATPKITQSFSPYNGDVADLNYGFMRTEIKESIPGSKKYKDQAKRELIKEGIKKPDNQQVEDRALRKYLYDIGGVRLQSFSDFLIENTLDYFQMFADLSAKELPLHAYSKEISFIKLFGMTGGKMNMSLIPVVDLATDKEHAGLKKNADGTYSYAGWGDYEHHLMIDNRSFIQSIGFKDAIALQLHPGYSSNIGTIAIGISDAHIRKMLNDPLIRMVIPYHSSGMLPEFAKQMHIDYYHDYTTTQNTTLGRCTDMNGNEVETYSLKGNNSYKCDTHFDFNEAFQRLGDAREACEEYKEWCKERHPVYKGSTQVGWAEFTPKFAEFADERNYYKLIEDFNSYDCITEAPAVQGAVTMSFPGMEQNLLDEEGLKAYEERLRATGQFTEKEIQKYVGRANETLEEIVTREAKNRNAYHREMDKKYDSTLNRIETTLQRDYNKSDYDLVDNKYVRRDGTQMSARDSSGKELTKAQAEYFKDSKVRDADGNLMVVYHGTPRGDFTVFDSSRIGTTTDYGWYGSGFYFTDKESSAKYYAGYLGSSRVMKGYLNITNPYELKVPKGESIHRVMADAMGQMFDTAEEQAERFTGWLKDNGYDGLITKGQYMIFDSNQFKNADNENPTENEDIRYSSRNTATAPTFYSKLQREIERFKGDRIGASSVESYLKGKGVKDEEIKWSGIRTFLDGKKSVNKAELMQYLKDNEVQIEETTLGGESQDPNIWSNGYRTVYTNRFYDPVRNTEYEKGDRDRFREDALRIAKEDGYDESDISFRFEDDYMAAESEDGETILEAYPPDMDELLDADYHQGTETRWHDYTLNGGKNYREILFKIPGSDYINDAMRAHWRKSGVLAHARVQDFDAADGKKALFVEEIQSDWHNAGQKHGYKVEGDVGISEEKAEVRFENGYYNLYVDGENTGSFFSPEYMQRKGIDKKDVKKALIEDYRKSLRLQGLDDTAPDAPFRTTYTDFVLKNLLRMAAEDDYDYLAWTTSAMQMERWNPARESTYALTKSGPDNDVAFEEGYRIEYDQQIPKFLKKYGKQWGAGLTEVNVSDYTVPAIAVNDVMRASILMEGQPRFSARNNSNQASSFGTVQELERRNDNIRQMNYGLDEVLQSRGAQTQKLSDQQIERIARRFIREYGSNVDPDVITSGLKSMYEYIDNTAKVSAQQIGKIATAYAEQIIDESKDIDDSMAMMYPGLSGEIKSTNLYVSPEVMKEMAYYFDSVADFRRQARKFITITEKKGDGRGIDTYYMELSENHPELFDPEIVNEKEQLLQIIDVAEQLKKKTIDKDWGNDYDEVAYTLGQDLVAAYFAEKGDGSYKRAVDQIKAQMRADHREQMANLRNYKDQQIKELRNKLTGEKRTNTAKIAELRARLQEQYRQREEKASLRRLTTQAKAKLQKQARELWSKRGKPEFERLKAKLFADLDLISIGISKAGRLNLEKTYKDARRQAMLDPDYAASAEYKNIELKFNGDPDNPSIERKKLRDLSYEEILDLTRDIIALKHSQQIYDKVLKDNFQAKVADYGRKGVAQQNVVKGVINQKGFRANALATMKRYALYFENPVRAAHLLDGYQDGGVLTELFDDINDGTTKKTQFQQQVNQMFEGILKNKKLTDGWADQNIEITVGGQKYYISKGMRISIALHAMNEDNKKHIKLGGFTIPDERLYKAGKYTDAYHAGQKVQMTEEDMARIASEMTPEEKEFMDIAHTFFNTTSKKAINETSMVLKGYELAVVPNYMPIRTNDNFTQADIDGLIHDGTIEGKGQFKDRKPNASNPILLEDIAQVIERQTKTTSEYYGIAIPVRNMNKVWNYTATAYAASMKESIAKNWGQLGKDTIEKVIKDIQMGARRGDTGDHIFSFLKGAQAASVLTLNIGVAAKQFASYPLAISMVDADCLAKGLTMKTDRAYIDSITPWSWDRRHGMGGEEMGDIFKQRGMIARNKAFQNVKDFANLIQKVDVFTTDHLFSACEAQIQKNNPDLEVRGEEYNKKVADLYNQVLWRTQPSYGVMQRNELMRSSSQLMKIFTAYKTQVFNMGGEILDAALRAQAMSDYAKAGLVSKTEAKKAMGDFGKIMWATALSQATLVILDSIARAFQHRLDPFRDEKGEVTAESVAVKTGVNFLTSWFGLFFGADVAEQGLAAIFNLADWYDITPPQLDGLNDTINDMQAFSRAIASYAEETDEAKKAEKRAKVGKTFAKVLITGSGAAGVPAQNIYNILNAVNLHIQDASEGGGGLLSFEAGEGLLGLRDTSPTNEQYAKQALYYYKKDNFEKGDRAAGKTKNTAVQSAIGAKSDYKDGKAVTNSKKYNTIDRIMAYDASNEAKGKMFAAAYPSDDLDAFVENGGSPYDYMIGQLQKRNTDKLSKDEKKKIFTAVAEDRTTSLEEKKAWLVSEKGDTDAYKEWKAVNGTDWDFIKYSADMETFVGLPAKEKKEKTVAYIKRQTNDRAKQRALYIMAGYDSDSKKDGNTVKDGNFKKAFGYN